MVIKSSGGFRILNQIGAALKPIAEAAGGILMVDQGKCKQGIFWVQGAYIALT